MLFVVPRDLGKVYPDGTDYDLPNGDSVVPDVSYFSAENALPHNAALTVAPDLAVEVISPSNTPAPIRRKINGYLESGTRLVWAVYPDEAEIEVYWRQDDGSIDYKVLHAADTLTGEDVVPGFSTAVSAIFPQLKPVSSQTEG